MGRDPPTVTNDSGKKMMMNVIARLLPDEPSPKDVKVQTPQAPNHPATELKPIITS
jgi:hypothetical protein